ncbi:hypothetical protein TWF730_009438 [Orbilia blumenaviensis]|uniref:RRM domain-containing protein n=1 Tax=Orbilia blumenaviensis TaxID=1796055 RepID=A0AAV9V2A6_9PEZI
MGGRRFPDREPQNERLMIHIAGIPPMMPEDVVKQAATQFGPVKEFFKVSRHYEKAYEYAPCFGFLTFEHEDSVARALDAGWMIAGDSKLSLNARRPREHRNQRPNGDFRPTNLPGGPGVLPDRPPPVRGQAQAPVHSRKQSNGSQFENKGSFPGPNRGTRPSSSTCTIYGLPETFVVQDLTERGSSFGRVINAHIFEYKDRDGRRFGTINFDSSSVAEEFHNKENGQIWNGCTVKITFEPFNIARRNNAPPIRSGNSGSQNFHRHEQRSFEGPKRFPSGNRGPRYPPNNGMGRFNNRGPFQPHGSGYQPQFQGPNQQHYPQEHQFYDPQMVAYQQQQYQLQYPQAMGPHPMANQVQYGSGVVSPPMPYGQQMAAHGIQGQYHSPPPVDQTGMLPMHSGHVPYPGTAGYPQGYGAHRNVIVGDSPNSKHSSGSTDTIGNHHKASGETSLTAPNSHPDMHQGRFIVPPENYRHAGYAYPGHISENVHPLTGPSEPAMLPATVPETKDPEDPSNIFIKNIDDDVISKPEHLEEYCKKFGEVVSISLPAYGNGLIKGFGFVKFTTPEAALKAKEELNLQIVGRRRLFVSFAETSDHRQSRLAKFYDQGARSDRELSPPDPLIHINDKNKTPEKKKQIDEEVKGRSSIAQTDGDATIDIPAGKPADEQPDKKKPEDLKDALAVEKIIKPQVETAPTVEKPAEVKTLKGPASEVTSASQKQEKKTEGIEKAEKVEKEGNISAKQDEAQDIPDAETNGTKGKSIGRKLTPEEAMKRDPAIVSVERPESTDVSKGSSTSHTASVSGAHPKELKDDRLKLVLKGLQNTNLDGVESKDGTQKDPPDSGQSAVPETQRSNNSERKELGEGVVKALRDTGNKSQGLDNECVPHPPTRSDTRNSTSSSGSRVSQEEFSEALKEKFGPKIPSTIRAADVMDAVDKYVESRNGTREPSPATKNDESLVKKDDDQAEAGMSNIVAPAPSRKVSIRKITPSDAAESKTASEEEGKVEVDEIKIIAVAQGSEENTTKKETQTAKPQSPAPAAISSEVPTTISTEAPVAVSTQAPTVSTDIPRTEQTTHPSTTQSIPTLKTDERSAYHSETGSSSKQSGSGVQQKNVFGGSLNHPRSYSQGPIDSNHRQDHSNGSMTSSPHSKYSRGSEYPQQYPGFHGHHNDQYNPHINFGPHSPGPHPPTMICNDPCPQPQCQPPFSFVPIPDMSHMFQGHINARMQQMGQMPFYDPAMYHGQYGYPADNNGFHPQFFGGTPPAMHVQPQPQPQWSNTGNTSNGNNGPVLGPHSQGGFVYPPPHPYSPPHFHQPTSPPRMGHMDQSQTNRGFQEHGHPQMHQQFGGPFPDQGMQGSPQPPFHGQGQYRPPPHEAGAVGA